MATTTKTETIEERLARFNDSDDAICNDIDAVAEGRQAGHTATPWRADLLNATESRYRFVSIDGDSARILCDGQLSPQDAAFIVQAVNAHAELVAALQQCRNVLYADDAATAKAVSMVDAALRLAGGE